MNVANMNPLSSADSESMTDSSSPQTNLGWEGHVHFQEEGPMWSRLLETYPELRTGLSYGLIFASGALLGAAIMALAFGNKSQSKTIR